MDGVLLPIELPIREVLLEFTRFSELAAGCFATAGADGFSAVIKRPMRERSSSLVVRCSSPDTRDTRYELRVFELAAPALPVLAMPDPATAGADGFSVVIERPIRERSSSLVVRRSSPDTRDTRYELRVFELVAPALPVLAMPDLATVGADGFSVVIELPMRKLEPVVGCLLDTETDGVLLLIELPIDDVMLELMRVLELVTVCLPLLELVPIDFPALERPEEGF